MKEHYIGTRIDEKYLNDKDLLSASREAGKESKKLVDLIEREFKVSRFKATIGAAAIVASVQLQIESNEECRDDIREILEELPDETN